MPSVNLFGGAATRLSRNIGGLDSMKYFESSRDVRVGDHVLYDGYLGVVVYVADDDAWTDRYPKEECSFLGSGFGIEWLESPSKGQVAHFTSSEDDEDLTYWDPQSSEPRPPLGQPPPFAGGGGPETPTP